MRLTNYFILVAAIFCLPSVSVACPTVNSLFDFNCDGEVKIVLIGDSITYGIGDLKNGNRGGYGRRLQNKYFPSAKVITIAKPGITSTKLINYIKVKRRADQIRNADFSITLIGTNDFFEEDSAPLVEENILKVQRFLRGLRVSVRLVSTLLQTNRPYQEPFVESVNLELLNEAKVRFDTLDPTTTLSVDNLHPDSTGYDAMANVAADALIEASTTARAKYKDSDGDQIPDRFERDLFSTNPDRADTDSDGVDDYTEIFVDMTDPLS